MKKKATPKNAIANATSVTSQAPLSAVSFEYANPDRSLIAPDERKDYDPDLEEVLTSIPPGDGCYADAAFLVHLAAAAIRQLERLSEENLWKVRYTASHRTTWPVLDGHHNAIRKKNIAFIEKLELGVHVTLHRNFSDLPIKYTPAKQLAFTLIELTEQIRSAVVGSAVLTRASPNNVQPKDQILRIQRSIPGEFTQDIFPKLFVNLEMLFEMANLPALEPSVDCINQWHTAIWHLLLLNTDSCPEKIAAFRRLGAHRRFHPYPVDTEFEIKKSLVPIKKQNANIQREIKVILKDEVRKLAQHLVRMGPTQDESNLP